MQKIGLNKLDYVSIFILYFFVGIINFTFVSYAGTDIEDDGTYTVDYRYLPRYSLTSNPSNYINLEMYYSGNNSYYDEWQHAHTYTVEGNSAVNLYTLIDSYKANMFSIRCRIDDHSDLYAFKLQNMYIYYEYEPAHVIPEKLQIQGSVSTFIPDSWTEFGYSDVQLQARSRVNGEWETLKMYQVHYGEVYPLYYYLEEGSINYDAYRIWFNFWDLKFNGYTLVLQGQADPNSYGTNICSCDFYNTSEDNTEQLLEDLKELQQNTISSIDNVGDLIKSLPDLLLDGIYDLFVPSDLKEQFSDYLDELLEEMGILGFPFEFAKREIEDIATYNAKSTIDIPSIEVMEQPILDGFTFDLATIGNIQIAGFHNLTLISIVRAVTSFLFAYALSFRIKSVLSDFGIIKSADDDLGGGV